MIKRMDTIQKKHDQFYWANGKCCAGCDHWQWHNSRVGECTRTAPVPSDQRFTMIGIHAASIDAGAGHIMTPREHVCGEFIDTYAWPSGKAPGQ